MSVIQPDCLPASAQPIHNDRLIIDHFLSPPIMNLGIEIDSNASQFAFAGDTLQVSLTSASLLPIHFSLSSILCSPYHCIPCLDSFSARVLIFDIEIPITVGVRVIFIRGSGKEEGWISSLGSMMDTRTGEVVKKKPR